MFRRFLQAIQLAEESLQSGMIAGDALWPRNLSWRPRLDDAVQGVKGRSRRADLLWRRITLLYGPKGIHLFAEEAQRVLQAFFQRHLWLPAE
jgi:hypothetical protein